MVSLTQTIDKLVTRGIAQETAEKVVNEFGLTSLKAITEAGAGALVEKGLSAEEAESVVRAAAGKKPAKESAASAPKKVDEPAVTFEYISKATEKTELELKLEKYRNEIDPALPEKVISEIASRLEKKYNEIPEEKYRELIVKADEMYKKRLMVPHESAGVVAAHSIGEPGTQMNMRTFHNAGVANILTTQGLPRLVEIVDARHSSTPSMDIPLKGLAKVDSEVAKRVSYDIEATKLIDIADIETDTTDMQLVIKPMLNKMDKRGITIDDIVDKLKDNRVLKGVPIEVGEIGNGYAITVSCPPDNPSYKVLQALSKAVRSSIIKGIEAVERALIVEDKENGGLKIVTEGSDLKAVLAVEGVDTSKVRTNDICEIESVLGIEAARNSIIEEASGTLADAGLTVDIRHIMLVADIITNIGYMKAIGRFGISGKKSSVLAKASFEITTKNLMIAAMSGVVDDIAGVAESIIVGQPVTLGTGAVNIIYKPKNNTQTGDEE